ncbi:RNA methyltransferase [Natronobacterium gregoryi]|uniref:tRNA (guanine(10)-N(2))-dimethyltransferase n=2 Tax=Natronobacterium gregoryi TaxID=44930 RepID=L0AII7_NATGS|nr:RNA methyltransferase [Natronobacterium gregoryi]AFZ72992.1 putative DNA modification methylase [Natronobacterium gregoryi SP2]ELY70073.1 RNA methylase [Natronobacterium gregoryi SP2]PLK19083.1 RNA methyltransferase [Natronobacterium gregoryi SP2]SFJ62425.1 N2-methylguanosine tRNA methyltransferase [Natronobacterium gregoryi]
MYLLELGGENEAFALQEAASAAADVRPIAPGLALANAVSPERVRGLAYTHRASDLVGRTDADPESAQALLEAASLDSDREGTIAVRATDVHGSTGVSTERVERALGRVLVDRGFSVDLDEPDHVLRATFSEGRVPTVDDGRGDRVSVCALGWLAAESVRDFGTRAPTDKPFFQPGSMDPLLARAIANVAGARPKATILDPMCGTGGVLVEAGLVGADVIGTDAQWKMTNGACENLEHFLEVDAPSPAGVERGSWAVGRGDATRLPLADDAVDGVVFDAPYGRQSKIDSHRLEDLVAGALSEARRVASRAVVVADRSWASEAREAGWELEASFERRVHRSLTRYVLVLSGDEA